MDMSSHPTASAAQPDDPHARIVAALRQRAAAAGSCDGANPHEAPACAGAPMLNFPALITALPGDHTRAPQTEFTRARQVLFLENLSITGSVRSAVASAGVSHQTAYRARRATGAFRTAWDAALVVARANADAVLASRAIDGITEEVRYHGEVVGTRTRYSDRLLLAHLGRLDKLAETPAAAAFADDFEGSLARFERGEEPVAAGAAAPAPEPAGPPEKLSPEPCNTRFMSYTEAQDFEEEDEDDDGIDWEDEEQAAAEIARLEAAMEAERPADAPLLTGEGPDGVDRDPGGLIRDAQFQAFVEGVALWWLVLPPAPFGGKGRWHYAQLPGPDANSGSGDGDDASAPGEGPPTAGDDTVEGDAAPGLEPEVAERV